MAKGDIVIGPQAASKAVRFAERHTAGAAVPILSGDLRMTPAEFAASATIAAAERDYIDSLSVVEALDYLAKHPATAVDFALQLCMDRRQLRCLRGALESLLDSIALEDPEGSRIFNELSTTLSSPLT